MRCRSTGLWSTRAFGTCASRDWLGPFFPSVACRRGSYSLRPPTIGSSGARTRVMERKDRVPDCPEAKEQSRGEQPYDQSVTNDFCIWSPVIARHDDLLQHPRPRTVLTPPFERGSVAASPRAA